MFRHVGIVVNNIQSMLDFYCDILNMDIISDEIELGPFLDEILGYQNIEARIIKLGKENKTIVELLDFTQKQNTKFKSLIKNGYSHFAITIKNSQETYKNLTQNNFHVLSEPKISPNNKFKVFFCKDPENNFVELVEILK